jgi:SH3-like domain-containing protein|tara:strand:- start:5975 stop:6412 length:438 start_codon:yes stop_codon:yes gene_type:complete
MSKIIILLLLFTNNLFASEEYFLTLRNDKVNLRQGPSFDYPIKIIYTKRYLPVLIQDKSNNFKKIRDHENNSGWIHVSQLSKKKAGITNVDELLVFKKPTLYSKPLVILSKGRLCFIKKCKNEWCKIETGEFIGWIMRKNLWGRI